MEKSLLDKLMHGTDQELNSHHDLRDHEDREESVEAEQKVKEEAHPEK